MSQHREGPAGQADALSLVLASSEFSEAEKRCLRWQFPWFEENGGFYRALWEAIPRADPGNLERLARGFPEDVLAYQAYLNGRLVQRWTDAGVSV